MKKHISAILILSLMLNFLGCTAPYLISKYQFINEEKKAVTITTMEGWEINLKVEEYMVVKDTIVASLYSDKIIKIPLSKVQKITAEEFSTINTIACIGVTGLFVLAISAFDKFFSPL